MIKTLAVCYNIS